MRLRSIAVTAALLAVPLVSTGTPRASAVTGDIDTSDRGSVTRAYEDVWQPAQQVDPGWTGSVPGCDAGRISSAAQTATLASINFARGLAGLTPASFTAEYDEQAQAAALMMKANNALDHHPPSTWTCWSQLGSDGAGSSNLYLFREAGPAIAGYLVDPGDSNTAVGHRRWVLNPDSLVMGHGATSGSDALKVFGSLGFGQQFANPAWVSWPTAGWFPAEMEPEGRWSLSAQRGRDADFSAASVTVRDASGSSLPVQIYSQRDGYGADTLVWKVSGLDTDPGTGERAYSVTVSGIAGDVPSSTSYTVRLFDPEAKTAPTDPAPRTRALVKAAKISGIAKAGKRLTVAAPVWSPAVKKPAYRWYRNGTAIAKAVQQRYTLTKKDRGARISVRITAAASGGYATATTTATLAKAVG